MLSQAQEKKLAVRREVLANLLKLGLSQTEASRALGMSPGAVKHDCRRFGFTPLKSPDAYKHCLWSYANMLRETPEIWEMSPEAFYDLKKALESYLNIAHLKGIATGIGELLKLFLIPNDPPTYRPYRKLISAVFGDDPQERWQMLEKRVLPDFLAEIAQNPLERVPDRRSVGREIAKRFFDELEDFFVFPLTGQVVEATDQALNDLAPREQDILRMRFGLLNNGQEMTLSEIASCFGNAVTSERFRQIEAKALRKLRHPARAKLLRPFSYPIGSVAERYIETLFPPPPPPSSVQIVRPKTVEEKDKVVASYLTLLVEELEISVRTYNCLKNTNIQTVQDLVQQTEPEMLRIKNFGRKSLNELKEILQSLGLCFGMKMHPDGTLEYPQGYDPES